MLDAGLSAKAIRHRLATGRLHRIHRGVYAVGRPELTELGRYMAAVLASGRRAVLSHASAAALWRIETWAHAGPIEVSVPAAVRSRHEGIVTHRRRVLTSADLTRSAGIPVTSVPCTLVDMATRLSDARVDAILNEADKRELIEWAALYDYVAQAREQRRPGAARLLDLIDGRLVVLTDSELERMLLRISREAGLPPPEAGVWLNGWKTDFYWPEFKLVVEADSMRHHRTAAQQTRDRERDQAHLLAGLTPLRFTHAQIVRRRRYVADTLAEVARRAQGRSTDGGPPTIGRAPE